jgi:two-component system chemotaxis sensor kinase CheA
LRWLRDEVQQGQPSPVDIQGLVARFIGVVESRGNSLAGGPPHPVPASSPANGSATAAATAAGTAAVPQPASDLPAGAAGLFHVEADISPTSIAPAARAFQLMLALQDLGEIVSMTPTQDQIEASVPVRHFSARLRTAASTSEIQRPLGQVSEVDHVQVSSFQPIQASPLPASGASSAASGDNDQTGDEGEPQENGAQENGVANPVDPGLLKFGEYLIANSLVTQQQLDNALQEQAAIQSDVPAPLGEVFVRQGVFTLDGLNKILGGFIQHHKDVVSSLQREPERARERAAEKTVRTSVERLDTLMNLVGELITDRNRLYQIRNLLGASAHGGEQIGALADTVAHLGRITDRLQEEVMSIRMLPVSNVFNKFPRMVRDLARKMGKDVDLVIRGQETELDRSVIEVINDPLIHLIRNAIDHGIESPEQRSQMGKDPKGTLLLSARHEQGRIILTVEDDGHGIDTTHLKAKAVQKGLFTEQEASQLSEEQALDLIFLSGLSTSENITDVSGRGVGMDIVRSNIERLNGSILVETHLGQGTRFQVILPLTLAIVPTLLVRVCGGTFAIPLVTVVETLRLDAKSIQTVSGKPVVVLRNQILSLIALSDVFGMADSEKKNRYSYVVVVRTSKLQIGLVVDSLVGEEELVVKSLGSLIGEVPGISSAAILGDGNIALILEVQGLFKLSGIY